MRTLGRSLLAALACLAAVAPSAAAQGEPSFALKAIGAGDEGYFVFDAAPGGTLSGTVLLVNAGNATGTARLDAVDATTGATTGAVYETVGEPSEDVGAWLRLDRREVTLKAGESVRVGFTAAIPSDARRGEHLGGIVAAPLEQAAGGGEGDGDRSFRVNVVNQSILAVQVDLPGAARQLLAVRGVEAGGQPGYQTLVLALSNPGERMVKGTGSVEVVRDGATVAKQRFTIDTFLPRTRIDYPLVVRGKALVPGDYRARIQLDWGTGTERTELPFSLTRKNIEQAFGSEGVAKLPDGKGRGGGSSLLPIVIGLVLLLVLGGAAGVLFLRRHTRRLEERILARQAAPPEEPRFTTGAEADQPRKSRR